MNPETVKSTSVMANTKKRRDIGVRVTSPHIEILIHPVFVALKMGGFGANLDRRRKA
jgi:hypothetical protein